MRRVLVCGFCRKVGCDVVAVPVFLFVCKAVVCGVECGEVVKSDGDGWFGELMIVGEGRVGLEFAGLVYIGEIYVWRKVLICGRTLTLGE